MPIRSVYADFGAKVRKRRAQLGLTQSALGDQIELSRASVANIEAGRQTVLLHQFVDLVRALDCEPTALFPSDDRRITMAVDAVPQHLPTDVKRFIGELDSTLPRTQRGPKT